MPRQAGDLTEKVHGYNKCSAALEQHNNMVSEKGTLVSLENNWDLSVTGTSLSLWVEWLTLSC